jgi:hypothetical protein
MRVGQLLGEAGQQEVEVGLCLVGAEDLDEVADARPAERVGVLRFLAERVPGQRPGRSPAPGPGPRSGPPARAPTRSLEAYVAMAVPRRTLGVAARPPAAPGPRPGKVRTHPEVDMAVLIVSIGIMLAVVLTLTVMGRRERRTRERIALDECGILDARRHNDATASR